MKRKEQLLLEAVRGLFEHEEHATIAKKLAQYDDEQLLKLFFKDYSQSQRDNLSSLSRVGVAVLKLCFDHWEINLQEPLTTKQHLLIAKNSKLPYYLDKKTLVTFEASVGVLLKIAEGNNAYIEQTFID